MCRPVPCCPDPLPDRLQHVFCIFPLGFVAKKGQVGQGHSRPLSLGLQNKPRTGHPTTMTSGGMLQRQLSLPIARQLSQKYTPLLPRPWPRCCRGELPSVPQGVLGAGPLGFLRQCQGYLCFQHSCASLSCSWRFVAAELADKFSVPQLPQMRSSCKNPLLGLAL